MTLSDWDQKVSPHLQFIEAGAQMAERHARLLPCRPEWPSRAQADLEQTRKVLESALAAINGAQAAYESKPCEADHAAA